MHKASRRCTSALMALLALSQGGLWAQSTIRWNVLWFMSDMHSPHFMSVDHQCPQNVYTPNLDRLAKEGMVFDKAYVAYPLCAPTRASILTGEYPQKHGKLTNNGYLVTAGPTGATPSLGHLFRNAGFNTAMMGKTHTNMLQWDMSPDSLFEGKNIFLGFDYRQDDASNGVYPGSLQLAPSPDIYAKKQSFYSQNYTEALKGDPTPSWEKPIWDATPDPGIFGGGAINAPLGRDNDGLTFFDALEYLEAYANETSKSSQSRSDFKIKNSAKPFFLYVSIKKPHEPYQAAGMHDSIDFYAMYSGRPADDNLTYRFKTEMRKKLIPNNLTREDTMFDMGSYPTYGTLNGGWYMPTLSQEAIRLSRARYSSAASWVDNLLGGVMDKLELLDDPNNPGKKLSQTTIVVYTSDHGDMLGEKHREGKLVMHEASARIPFLIRMPGVIPPGARSNILVNHVDMIPTLAGLCGLGDSLKSNKYKSIAGKDLSAAIIQNNAAAGPVRTFTEANFTNNDPTKHPLYVMGRTQQFKFIRSSQKRPDGLPYMVLFDMEADPHETKNLADDPKYAAIVNRESAAMDTFLLQFGVPPVNLQLTVSTRISATPVSSEDLKVVNGIGHISFIPGKNLQDPNSVAEICIYSPNGALLKRIALNSTSAKGYSWNLRSDAGKKVKSNLYLYRYTIKNKQGREISRNGKLVRAGR